MISFTFKPRKFASVVAYFATRRPGITKKELCNIIYFADKEHLLRYGRTITGDRYYALEQGPVPTRGLDALNGKNKHPVGAFTGGDARGTSAPRDTLPQSSIGGFR